MLTPKQGKLINTFCQSWMLRRRLALERDAPSCMVQACARQRKSDFRRHVTARAAVLQTLPQSHFYDQISEDEVEVFAAFGDELSCARATLPVPGVGTTPSR